MLLQPKSYVFKDGESGRTHIGFISQDVEEALDACRLTSLDFAGFLYIYSLRYEEFIALNTMMIQKLYSQNMDFEDRITKIEKLICHDN